MNEAATGRVRRWLWIATIWFAIALFEATQTVFGMRVEGMQHNWGALFVTVLLSWLPWALVTPLALRLGRDQQLNPLTWLMHASVAVSVNVVSSAWTAGIILLLNPYATSPAPGPFVQVWFGHFYSGLLSSLMLYSGVLASGQILESRTRLARQQTETARLNEQLSKAQLNALRRQIEPHFLFNSLNSIAGLVRDKQNDAAVTMIARLSDFLRRVVEDSNRQLVPLAEEMDCSERYLQIQKVRFAERLQLSVEVPDNLRSAQVPSLLLQPMVENAVKHGISKRAQGGAIRISASRNGGILTLRVYNDGPTFPLEAQATSGVGMANVRTRLHSLYGDAFRLSVQNQEPDGVEVAVSVPYTES
jgi:two-component system LytT family sensor kinase